MILTSNVQFDISPRFPNTVDQTASVCASIGGLNVSQSHSRFLQKQNKNVIRFYFVWGGGGGNIYVALTGEGASVISSRWHEDILGTVQN